MRQVIHKIFKCTLFGFRFWYLALDSGWDGRVNRHWMWFQGCGGCRAVVEMVPGGVPFHLGNCWCCSGDFDCSFSPGLVSLSPEHPGPWSPGSTPLGRSSSGSGILLLLLSSPSVARTRFHLPPCSSPHPHHGQSSEVPVPTSPGLPFVSALSALFRLCWHHGGHRSGLVGPAGLSLCPADRPVALQVGLPWSVTSYRLM